MKTLKLTLLSAVMVFGGSGCATINKLFGGKAGALADKAGDVGGDLVRRGPEIKAKADKKAEQLCGPIKNSEVGWPEERAMGGSVGVGLASSGGGLFIDNVTPIKDTRSLDELRVKAEKKEVPALTDSEKNALATYVLVVGRNLARYSSRPTLPWTFAVVNNEAPNAFSAPGGYVFITTGLLRKITNEAQLAGVLSHEIAHVTHKHAVNSYKDIKYTQCSLATQGGVYLAEGAEAIMPAELKKAVNFAKYFEKPIDLDNADGSFVKFLLDAVVEFVVSRGNGPELEFQADRTALELVSFAGYDPSEYEKFLTSLGSQGGGLFSHHPKTEDRVAKLKELREGELKPFAVGTAKPDTAKQLAAAQKK